MARPNHIDTYENGEVTISIYQWTHPLRNTYWIKAGIAELELTEAGFGQLTDLFVAYREEELRLIPRRKAPNKVVSWVRYKSDRVRDVFKT